MNSGLFTEEQNKWVGIILSQLRF